MLLHAQYCPQLEAECWPTEHLAPSARASCPCQLTSAFTIDPKKSLSQQSLLPACNFLFCFFLPALHFPRGTPLKSSGGWSAAFSCQLGLSRLYTSSSRQPRKSCSKQKKLHTPKKLHRAKPNLTRHPASSAQSPNQLSPDHPKPTFLCLNNQNSTHPDILNPT